MGKSIVIASDHAGYFLKEKIKEFLQKENYKVIDVGCFSPESVDYPEYGAKAVGKILNKEADFGILICGTGLGMSIVANRFSGIRAALCHEPFSAKMARLHNNANVLVLGGRIIGDGIAIEIVKVFLETPFEGGRHERRINLIEELTKNKWIS
ncbi:MAG: ribose 5-phosphate isomerase B [Thermodesulfobacterium geofontis]|uniref:Ribose 5-phosphate isomerase B n=1 Tax=Thermodesulfobacterium geofontis TaxID=1295609 RepID=A0A2N7QG39_9BACT|nr:MAG: ribose 5-phosphate isomerase B [Thermodesulfobacterium geofontis]PMP97918.1 MAG: ribose 5-phosphate isomerase B [Thermodesulfobacterium geofontis]